MQLHLKAIVFQNGVIVLFLVSSRFRGRTINLEDWKHAESESERVNNEGTNQKLMFGDTFHKYGHELSCPNSLTLSR